MAREEVTMQHATRTCCMTMVLCAIGCNTTVPVSGVVDMVVAFDSATGMDVGTNADFATGDFAVATDMVVYPDMAEPDLSVEFDMRKEESDFSAPADLVSFTDMTAPPDTAMTADMTVIPDMSNTQDLPILKVTDMPGYDGLVVVFHGDLDVLLGGLVVSHSISIAKDTTPDVVSVEMVCTQVEPCGLNKVTFTATADVAGNNQYNAADVASFVSRCELSIGGMPLATTAPNASGQMTIALKNAVTLQPGANTTAKLRCYLDPGFNAPMNGAHLTVGIANIGDVEASGLNSALPIVRNLGASLAKNVGPNGQTVILTIKP